MFCGLNRRYAPLIQQIKKDLKTDQTPAIYDYIINAGFIPKDHWVQDEKIGGGRIIGEACHFIDTIQYLDGSLLMDVKITYAQETSSKMKDNALITLKFESGAVANIIYTSMGSKKYPKEQLRVFSSGVVYELDNYTKLNKYSSLKFRKTKLIQNKGIQDEYKHIAAVLFGKEENNTIEDAFVAFRKLIDATRTGNPSDLLI